MAAAEIGDLALAYSKLALEFRLFGELNARLQERCRADLDRRLWGEEETEATLLEEDRAAMLPIPERSFDRELRVEAHRLAA